MASQSLDRLIASIGNAFTAALHATDQHNLATFMDSFEAPRSTADGAEKVGPVKPKTIALPLPQPDGTYATRDVPVAALLHHNSLQLDELRIKLRITLDQPLGDGVQAEVAPSLAAKSAPDTAPNVAEVELTFKRGDPPEGVARIAQQFHQSL